MSDDPSRLRISDEDRFQVTEKLRLAAGEGRLDLEELDQRLEAAHAARTYADLVPITHDLPGGAPDTVAASAARPLRSTPMGGIVVPNGPDHGRGIAVMGGFERKGLWKMPRQLDVLCLWGGAQIDLREAEFAAHEVTVRVVAVMGGAEIKVNERTRVVMDGIGIMGGFSAPSSTGGEQFDESSPTVRVTGFAIMGGVSVERAVMPDEEVPFRLRRRRNRELRDRRRELRDRRYDG